MSTQPNEQVTSLKDLASRTSHISDLTASGVMSLMDESDDGECPSENELVTDSSVDDKVHGALNEEITPPIDDDTANQKEHNTNRSDDDDIAHVENKSDFDRIINNAKARKKGYDSVQILADEDVKDQLDELSFRLNKLPIRCIVSAVLEDFFKRNEADVKRAIRKHYTKK